MEDLIAQEKRFGLKQSSWPLPGHPLISAWNTKLCIFLYLRTFCLPKRQSRLAARTLLYDVENASSNPYFTSGSSKDLKINFLGARCCSMQYTILYAHWHLHTWSRAVAKATSSWSTPRAQPKSGAMVTWWGPLQLHWGSHFWDCQLTSLLDH